MSRSRPRHHLLTLATGLVLALFALPAPPAHAAGEFVDSGFSLTGVGPGVSISRVAVAWGDVDGDGDLDLLVLGSPTGFIADEAAYLYRNDGATFTSIPTAITPTSTATATSTSRWPA